MSNRDDARASPLANGGRLVGKLFGQVGRRMNVSQRRDYFLFDKPDGTHQFLMLDAAEHHPVAYVRHTYGGQALELLDNGIGTAEERPVQVAFVV